MSAADDLRRLYELHVADVGEIDEALHPEDGMWDGNEAHYRTVGESAIRCVRLALLAGERSPDDVKEVLDLGSGYGRVLRYLQQVLPDAAFTACDIDRVAVDFCAEAFGATPVYSDVDPLAVEFPGTYDLIWCGSLLTHLDAQRWREYVGLFQSLLNLDGIVVFTAMGSTMPRHIASGWDYAMPAERLQEVVTQFRREGFGYVDYDHTKGYGVSIASPAWATGLIAEHPALSLLYYREWGWDRHQDVVACIKRRHESPPGPAADELAGLDLGP